MRTILSKAGAGSNSSLAAGLFLLLLLLRLSSPQSCQAEFRPGQIWKDTSEQPIQAHGGGILVHDNTYFWYGEDRTPGTRGGVACYSSTDLQSWKREGRVLPIEALEQKEPRAFIERPKVIFNPKTGKYVMWMHLERSGYHFARAGIALGDTPTNTFTFLHAIRPITNDFGFDPGDANQEKEFGGTFRDMNLFVDDDGSAYAFYSSENNWTMYVVRLNDSFTGPELPAIEGKTWARILVRKMREAPAPFKHNGRYYLITSGCTGWTPNEADCAVAEDLFGPWESKGNPCSGPDAKTTFNAQSTFVLPVAGKPGAFIFMADQWKPRNLSDSRYVWLPIEWTAAGTPRIEWRDEWDVSIFRSLSR